MFVPSWFSAHVSPPPYNAVRNAMSDYSCGHGIVCVCPSCRVLAHSIGIGSFHVPAMRSRVGAQPMRALSRSLDRRAVERRAEGGGWGGARVRERVASRRRGQHKGV